MYLMLVNYISAWITLPHHLEGTFSLFLFLIHPGRLSETSFLTGNPLPVNLKAAIFSQEEMTALIIVSRLLFRLNRRTKTTPQNPHAAACGEQKL
jgi:hypothetical protein